MDGSGQSYSIPTVCPSPLMLEAEGLAEQKHFGLHFTLA